jgi:hypothetical protein
MVCAAKAPVRGWRFALIALSMFAANPTLAHHQRPGDGQIHGVAIPAIAHGEMLVIAKYRNEVLALAARQPVTDPTLRRLAGFVSLQHFACFWGLVPGSLSDDTSPFNECSHADLAGVKVLLMHMMTMPGDQAAAKALQARIAVEMAGDPIYAVVCSNSSEVFDSANVMGPDWQLAPRHMPTVLTFSLFLLPPVAGLVAIGRRRK